MARMARRRAGEVVAATPVVARARGAGDQHSSGEESVTPYVERDREDWAALAAHVALPIDTVTLDRARGRNDPTSLADVAEVYLPLTRLLSEYVLHTGALHRSTNAFLGVRTERTPFVIGVAGSVAVGKSTTSRLLKELLSLWPEHPRVELLTTDGFLLPNAELERRGIVHRKGFPESYDRRALLRFVIDVKSGRPEVTAPVYSHLSYDILPDERVTVTRPDILIVEGLNVLQPARVRADGTTGLALSDFFDFSVYVDAAADDIRAWYVQRFLSLRDTAFRDPRSYFTRYAALTETEAVDPGHPAVGHHQRAEPRGQHPPDPRARHRHPAQRPRPPRPLGASAQGLIDRSVLQHPSAPPASTPLPSTGESPMTTESTTESTTGSTTESTTPGDTDTAPEPFAELSRLEVGDLTVQYLSDDDGQVGLRLFPTALDGDRAHHRRTLAGESWVRDAAHAPAAVHLDPLVHVKIVGDAYAAGFAQGRTLRGSTSNARFTLAGQEVTPTGVRTTLSDPTGLRLEHRLSADPHGQAVEVGTTFTNDSPDPVRLELLTSFSFGGITPFAVDDAPGRLLLHRFRSSWSAEGRPVSDSVEHLQLERSWSGTAANSERFGQVGTMPVRGWFPTVVAQDTVAGVCWGARLGWAGSWQLEASRTHDDLCLSGGQADRELGHWTCTVAPGASLSTPPAYLTCVAGDVDAACERLVSVDLGPVEAKPEVEHDLPLIYNEWCTTWGEPQHDQVLAIADKVAPLDVRYLVIDAGWYRPEDPAINWFSSNGDWVPSARLFPDGIEATAAADPRARPDPRALVRDGDRRARRHRVRAGRSPAPPRRRSGHLRPAPVLGPDRPVRRGLPDRAGDRAAGAGRVRLRQGRLQRDRRVGRGPPRRTGRGTAPPGRRPATPSSSGSRSDCPTW